MSAKLTQGAISTHLVQQTVPMLLGIACIMSVGILDAYFIGQLGADALAAVSFIFPVTVALSSLGVGVLAGIGSVVARDLGAGLDDRAESRANLGLTIGAVAGLSIAAVLYVLKGPLFALMGADEALAPLIDAYMTPFTLGFPLLLTNMASNGVLRGQGLAKEASVGLFVFAIANWILDPLLIDGAFGFEGFGIAGAAYATLGGWAAGSLVGLYYVQTSALRFSLRGLRKGDWRSGAWAIVRVGAPAAGSSSINPIGLSVLTAFVADYGQAQVAGFGAAGRLQAFAVVPLLALSSSIGAVVGQNWGAGKLGRAAQALRQACGFSVVYGLATAALLVLLRDPLAGLFTDDAAVREAVGLYLIVAAWGFSGYGVLIVTNGAFNAVDQAGAALAVSIARVFLVMLPVAYFAGAAFGVAAVYGGELAAHKVGGTVSALVGWSVFRRKARDGAVAE
ncbi:MAG: MATE family efflux transporter [Myxococcota bacterium]